MVRSELEYEGKQNEWGILGHFSYVERGGKLEKRIKM
jgi:hypothetical protein